MKLGQAEDALRELEKQYDLKKLVKETMEFPIHDTTALFAKFASPDKFEGEEAVTRENATGNFDPETFKILVVTGSIRSNFIRFKQSFLNKDSLEKGNLSKEEYEAIVKDNQKATEWVESLINMIGDDILVRATTSKGKEGWLGNLIITSRRLGEVVTQSLKDTGKSMLGLRRR